MTPRSWRSLPAWIRPITSRWYAPLGGVHLRVEDARLYCNSNHSAEVYLTVEVLEGGGVYSEGEGLYWWPACPKPGIGMSRLSPA